MGNSRDVLIKRDLRKKWIKMNQIFFGNWGCERRKLKVRKPSRDQEPKQEQYKWWEAEEYSKEEHETESETVEKTRKADGVPEAIMKAGAVYKYDLSLPVEKMYDLVEEMRIRLGPAVKVVGYGHLGDGNLHLNISLPEYDDTVLAQIEPFVYEWTSKHRGSISAEHGLGLMKANKIHYSKSPESVNLMASIKKLLDPNGILNPYKVLPQSLTA
ncbi:hypothetical protein CsSME_00003359 [Camellia sinensis var. sinensis]